MPHSHQTTTETERHDEERRQEQIRRNQAALEMLRQWDQEDPDEQRATWEFLKHALDEDRPGQRPLFP